MGKTANNPFDFTATPITVIDAAYGAGGALRQVHYERRLGLLAFGFVLLSAGH